MNNPSPVILSSPVTNTHDRNVRVSIINQRDQSCRDCAQTSRSNIRKGVMQFVAIDGAYVLLLQRTVLPGSESRFMPHS